MELEYRREMNRNYMIICPDSNWEVSYTIQMIRGNKIPGLLPFYEKNLDGVTRYYYDITSKQPLVRVLEHRKITGEELYQLISDLICLLKQLERYLLDEGQIYLDPVSIYVEPDTFHSYFCVIPGSGRDFSAMFFEFSQYLLDHVDHSDGDAVVLAFSIFRESKNGNIGIWNLEKCLQAGGETKRAEPEVEHCMQNSLVLYEEPNEIHEEFEIDEAYIPGNRAVWLCICLAALIPAIAVVIFGLQGLMRLKWIIMIGEIALGVIIYLLFRKESEVKDMGETRTPCWEEEFFNEEIYEMESQAERQGEKREIMEDDLKTMLLTTTAGREPTRCLLSRKDQIKIEILYFPFLIGKSRSMADYCLNMPEVSRLHAKIEFTDGKYYITDLNSTNGTKVNGRMLDANETKELEIGAEIKLAESSFVFL